MPLNPASEPTTQVIGTIRELAKGMAGDELGEMGEDFLWQMPMRFYLRDVAFLSQHRVKVFRVYRGTFQIRNLPPTRTAIWPGIVPL